MLRLRVISNSDFHHLSLVILLSFNTYYKLKYELNPEIITARETRVSSLIVDLTINEKPEDEFSDIDPSLAVSSNNYEDIDIWFKRGGDPNYRNTRGISLLGIAMEIENEIMIEKILQAGADPNQVNF
jgi:ankyrin repeat protein